VKIAFITFQGSSVTVVPSGYLEGTVELNGKPVKVGVVDIDGDGVYGNPYSIGKGGDVLLIDRNGNGEFDKSVSTDSASLLQGEALPLFPLLPLDGERFYRVVVAADGSSIQFRPDEGPQGAVEFDGAKAALLLASGPRGETFALPSEGKCRLPVGSYTVAAVEYQVVDPNGAQWTVSIGRRAGRKVVVKAEKPFVLVCGNPFGLTLEATAEQGTHRFGVTAKDRGGTLLSNLFDAKGEPPEAPKLTITDLKGKVVANMSFAYG
jgi:hypothetical protein